MIKEDLSLVQAQTSDAVGSGDGRETNLSSTPPLGFRATRHVARDSGFRSFRHSWIVVRKMEITRPAKEAYPSSQPDVQPQYTQPPTRSRTWSSTSSRVLNRRADIVSLWLNARADLPCNPGSNSVSGVRLYGESCGF